MNRHTTLNGFKRAAKLLKNERCIPLHKAHEILARKEGYGNYSHAQKVLKSEQIGYKTTFLQNWRIRPRSHKGGCFEASVWTKTNPLEILTPSARKSFMKLKKEPNKLLYGLDIIADGEAQAKWYVGRCLRFMQFCDATGLTPGTSDYRRDPGSADKCPWSDHRRHWWDRQNKAYITSDEPYESRLMDWKGRTQEWGNAHGCDTLQLSWGSIYKQETYMVLFCKKNSGVDLKTLESKLDNIGSPLYVEE